MRGVQREDRDQRQGDLADRRAELADGLRDPEPPEVQVVPETTCHAAALGLYVAHAATLRRVIGKCQSVIVRVVTTRREATDEEARALASALRIRILRVCLSEPRTNKEIATVLGRDPATTLHHVRMLARTGFLAAQAERRGTRGSREIPYLATRKSWQLSTPAAGRVLLKTFLEEAALVPAEQLDTARLGMRLTDEPTGRSSRIRLAAVLDEFEKLPDDPDGEALVGVPGSAPRPERLVLAEVPGLMAHRLQQRGQRGQVAGGDLRQCELRSDQVRGRPLDQLSSDVVISASTARPSTGCLRRATSPAPRAGRRSTSPRWGAPAAAPPSCPAAASRCART